MNYSEAKRIALGGMLGALAMVIMCLVGLIPVATFVCPVLCMILCAIVLLLCGKRIAWAWYGAVSILSLLLAPDKEAALVFCFLGYYPIVKQIFDKYRLGWLYKFLLFNTSVLILYGITIRILGMYQILKEFSEMGTILIVVTVVLGNVTFLLFDRTINLLYRKMSHRNAKVKP